jgi:hypothetical protein
VLEFTAIVQTFATEPELVFACLEITSSLHLILAHSERSDSVPHKHVTVRGGYSASRLLLRTLREGLVAHINLLRSRGRAVTDNSVLHIE